MQKRKNNEPRPKCTVFIKERVPVCILLSASLFPVAASTCFSHHYYAVLYAADAQALLNPSIWES